MNTLDIQYTHLLRLIAAQQHWQPNRTGHDTKAIPSYMLTHQMSEGFPLLTIKYTPFRSVAVELEFFIRGYRDKKWLQERNCTIWDEWCNPMLHVPGLTPEENKERARLEDDLGLIYGTQWRDFHDPLGDDGQHIDQLSDLLYRLQRDPNDRRLVCTAWNPMALSQMALPPCHMMWSLMTTPQGPDQPRLLHLSWYQRSL